MKEWFNSLDARERKILIGGAIAVLLMSLYFLGWEPFITKIDHLKKSNAENEKTLTWMKQKAGEVRQLQRSNPSMKVDLKGQSLLGVIDKTAKSNNLGSAIKRVQPEGNNKALVRLEGAQFNHVIRWLEHLQLHQGIQVDSSVIERQSEPGLVNARIIFQTAT